MKNQEYLELFPITTERLIIRLCQKEDVELLLKTDKQEKTQKYLGGIKNKSREERLEFIKEKIGRSTTICLKDNTPIGFIGLKIKEDNYAEIGYLLDYDYWKNGYCLEACQKLLEIAFEKLDLTKVIADTVEGNIDSQRVLEKLGFEYEGKRIKISPEKEEITFLDYSILKEKYDKEHKHD